jgi:hypothetical protein
VNTTSDNTADHNRKQQETSKRALELFSLARPLVGSCVKFNAKTKIGFRFIVLLVTILEVHSVRIVERFGQEHQLRYPNGEMQFFQSVSGVYIGFDMANSRRRIRVGVWQS